VALRKTLVDPSAPAPVLKDWRRGLPSIRDAAVRLRELKAADAQPLARHLADPRVCQYTAPGPTSAAGYSRFIRWARAERRRGALACYGIVPAERTAAVGVIEVWPVERDFSVAEWGFVLSDAFWGTGLFERAARLFLDVVFLHLRVYRLEARVVDVNVSANRLLARLGATREGTLRGSFRDGDEVRDHVMWSILAPEWQMLRRGANDAD
jgi:ribosomal-protein-alanine N-acetyltransferase